MLLHVTFVQKFIPEYTQKNISPGKADILPTWKVECFFLQLISMQMSIYFALRLLNFWIVK